MHRKPGLPRPGLPRRFAVLFTLIGLTACTAPAPPYPMPAADVPAQFAGARLFQPVNTAPAVPATWWTLFGDNTLDALQTQLPEDNFNLSAALAQYRAAVAALEGSRAPMLPLVGTGLTASRARSPTAPTASTVYSPSATVSWEADLWGRIAAQVDAAQARVEASERDLAAIRLSLQSTLTQTYFGLRTADAQIALLTSTEQAYRRSLEMTQDRYRVGVVSAADVAQAQTQLKTAQAQLAELRGARSVLEHAVAVLVGQAPARLRLGEQATLPTLPDVPLQLPADLLRRRPDVAAAERRVAAANAQLGITNTAFFPALTLSANLSHRSSTLGDLISAPHLFWSWGPALALTAFDNRARQAAVDSAQAALDQAAASYRQTVLTAMQEVEDNLALAAALAEQTRLLEESLIEARRALELVLNQYRAGTVSYLNVVAAQTTALSVERSLLDARNRRIAAVNQLLRNLAGDWRPSTARGASG